MIDREPDGLNYRRALRAQLASLSFDYGSILVSDVSDGSAPAGDSIDLYADQL